VSQQVLAVVCETFLRLGQTRVSLGDARSPRGLLSDVDGVHEGVATQTDVLDQQAATVASLNGQILDVGTHDSSFGK